MAIVRTKVNYAAMISPEHKFSVVVTDGRDIGQANNNPVKDFNKYVELLGAAAKAGFDLETGGGDLPMNVLKNNQNPIQHQAAIKEALAKAGVNVDTEFLYRNINLVGYEPMAKDDLDFSTRQYAKDFSRGRIFDHSNNADNVRQPVKILQSMGLEAEVAYTPSYVVDPETKKIKPVFKTSDVVEYFQDLANEGVKRFSFKIPDGGMPADDIYNLVTELKKPGVLPKGSIIACHTHDTHNLGKEQYEAFLAAGGDVIHLSNPAIGGQYGQPTTDHFVKNYGSQINNLNVDNYKEYEKLGKKWAKENNFTRIDHDKFLEDHSKAFAKRLAKVSPEAFEKKFGLKLKVAGDKVTEEQAEKANAITINKAAKIHKENMQELYYLAQVPGGGGYNLASRAKQMGWIGDNPPQRFREVDYLEESLKKLVENKPKLGGNSHVTPNYRNSEEFANAQLMTAGKEVEDIFIRRALGEDRPVYLNTRKIFTGEYGKPQLPLDPKLLELVRKTEMQYTIQELRKASFVNTGDVGFYSNERVIEGIESVAKKITHAYNLFKTKDHLEKQIESVSKLAEQNNDPYYTQQLTKLNQRLDEFTKMQGNTTTVNQEEYCALMSEGKLIGNARTIVERSNRVSVRLRSERDETALGHIIKSQMFLQCPASEILPSRKAAVKEVVDEYNTKAKEYSKVIKTYEVDHQLTFGLLARGDDPAAPEKEQWIAKKDYALGTKTKSVVSGPSNGAQKKIEEKPVIQGSWAKRTGENIKTRIKEIPESERVIKPKTGQNGETHVKNLQTITADDGKGGGGGISF